MQLFRRRPRAHRAPPTGPVVLEPIGFVRNAVARPRPHGWERVRSELHLLPVHARRLAGLERFSHVIVVFYMDLAAEAPVKPEVLPQPGGREAGIFATRSQLRPNHLGVSAVALLGVEGTVVRVRGLDAIDGTLILDLKPYLPHYDAIPGARTK